MRIPSFTSTRSVPQKTSAAKSFASRGKAPVATAAPEKRQETEYGRSQGQSELGRSISTRKDGAVVVVEQGHEAAVLTIAPPTAKGSASSNAKEMAPKTLIYKFNDAYLGYEPPVFKLTPFLFETGAGVMVADGFENYLYTGQNLTTDVVPKVAIRPGDEFPRYGGPTLPRFATITAYDSIFTLGTATAPSPSHSNAFSVALEPVTSGATSAVTATNHKSESASLSSLMPKPTYHPETPHVFEGPSRADIAAGVGIGMGVVGGLLLVSAGALLVKRYLQRQKQNTRTATEEFGIRLKPLNLVFEQQAAATDA